MSKAFKFKFKWVGWASLIMLLTAFVTIYSIYFVLTLNTLEVVEKIFPILFGGISMLVALVVLWWIVLTEFSHLEISADSIEFRNLITGRTTTLRKDDLRGFTTESTRGYISINLINSKNKTVKSIREMYYDDLTEIVSLIQLRSLG